MNPIRRVRGRFHSKAARPLDILGRTPHELWLLPRHAQELGTFVLSQYRPELSLGVGRLVVDIVADVDNERYSLLLPRTPTIVRFLTAWRLAKQPAWRCYLYREYEPHPRLIMAHASYQTPYQPIGPIKRLE